MREPGMGHRVGADLPAPGDHPAHHGVGEGGAAVDHDVEHGRVVVAAQQRSGVAVLVDVAIVEGEHYGPLGQLLPARPRSPVKSNPTEIRGNCVVSAQSVQSEYRPKGLSEILHRRYRDHG